MRLLAALTLLAALPAAAQEATFQEVAIRSEILGAERKILVRLPPLYGDPARRYPVLYFTDAGARIALLSQTVRFLSANGRMPEMILVGIEPVDRTNELTPTKGFLEGFDGNREVKGAGGAARFLAFVEQELVPWVERTYRTEPFRVLSGHSYGGLFALYTLEARPELFQARIAVAPTLQWEKDLPVRWARGLAARKGLRGALVVTMGDEGALLARRLEEYRAALRSAPAGLRWKVTHYADEDHGSVLFDSQYHALKEIFAGWRMPVADDAIGPRGGLAAVEAHYAKLSERLEWTVRPPEGVVNLAGYQQLQDGDLDQAIRTFQRNVEWYRGSANVHDSLGEAYEKAGRLDDAARSYRAAWEAGEKAKDPNVAVYRRNLERVTAAAGAAAAKAGAAPR